MNKIFLFLGLFLIVLIVGCGKSTQSGKGESNISSIAQQTIDQTIKSLLNKYGDKDKIRIEKGVRQAASYWTKDDGSSKEFQDFCISYFISSDEELDNIFQRLSTNFEVLGGHFNKIVLDLNRPLHLDIGEMLPVDILFGAYNPSSHLMDDFYKNKIAFHVLLNFPFYTLKEKEELGINWSRKEWAYARVGDIFTSRIPADLLQKISDAMTNSGNYIAQYNIFAGNLTDSTGKIFFPKDMKLLSHWNLRDEIKSQYSKPDGMEKQKIIFQVMKRIISQEIPENVINSDKYTWDPYRNIVLANGKEVQLKSEPNTRYQMLLNNFKSIEAIDKYTPDFPTYIKRKFEQEYEIPQEKVEELFIKFVSSPTVKKVAELISKRLGRQLEPYDIWYDGFKSRSGISQDELTANTSKKYPNAQAFAGTLPGILEKLGFTSADAISISSKIDVDPARGSGHAWGAEMKSEKAHLRTRISKEGMDYKGYNIAVHEFGHNVEQTITLQDVDYYMLKGVPNTAFTEAWAFVFQSRDLDLLGISTPNGDKKYLRALDNFWSCYEIMGVSLVDMNVWKWLYKHPNASSEELKKAVILIAKDIWNKYFSEPFGGIKDQPILAIYSHMIENPLYLSAYPIGHLIEFQMEQYIDGKNLGTEMKRMLTQGRIVPQLWMKGAVGKEIAIEPTLDATEDALLNIK